jgi:hypothetical protein
MELTAIAICASLLMALAALCVYILAVKKDYFRDIEDTKYQVFWSDLEEMVDLPLNAGQASGCPTKEHHHARDSNKVTIVAPRPKRPFHGAGC